MLLGLEAEGVHVDATGGDVLVVLERLDQVEVATVHLGEAIVAIQLDLGDGGGVVATLERHGQEHAVSTTGGNTGHATSKVVDGVLGVVGAGHTTVHIRHAECGGAGVGHIEVISVVEPLGTEVGTGLHGVNVVVGLHHPDELLGRMVEVQLDLVVGGGGGLVTGELELFDQIFMTDLSEATTFIGIEVHVVDVQGR